MPGSVLHKKIIYITAVTMCLLSLSSCGSHRLNYDFRELAAAALRLDMDIDVDDNHRLYIEASSWIGVPYRYGGKTKKGVDCSGLTSSIYRTVYGKRLSISAEEQRDNDCKKVLKKNLREGDLVFFHNGSKKKRASHVGIYLKNGRFIHASSSVGVVVSSLDERYYSNHWLQGGRVK